MFRVLVAVAWCLVGMTNVWAADSLRIDARELESLIREQRVVVLDARPAEDYQKGHLPDSRSLPFSLTFEDKSQNGRVIPLAKARALFSAAGLKQDEWVVVYDAGSMLHAARLLWALEVYGHDKVRLLDGGLKAWQLAGMLLSQEEAQFTPTQYVPRINSKRLATRMTTLVASRKQKAYTILDARPVPHYDGQESEARRYGHIPKAMSMPVGSNLADDGIHLKRPDDLAKQYGAIPKNKKVVTYCSIGLASSLQYLVLRELGYDVANYDASWKEWGNDASLPIVVPPQIPAKP